MNYLKKHEYLTATIIILVTTTIFLLPQLNNHATILSNDGFFHYSRFFDIYQQLQTGHFNAFQMNYTFDSSGRIINAFYGPIFAFFNALLLFICPNWLTYQILTNFIVFIIGGLGLFRLLRYSGAKLGPSLSVIPLFLAIGSMPLWPNGTSFMGWSAALSPWILLLGIKMVKDKQEPINWLYLALGIGLVTQIHIISTVMFVLALIPFYIIGFVLTSNRISYIINTLKAILTTILLSTNIIYNLITMKKNSIAFPSAGDLPANAMKLGINNLRSNLLLFVLILFLCQLIFALIHFKSHSFNAYITIYATLWLLISSKLFPWGYIQTLFPFLRTTFQAPYRFNVIVYPLFLLGIALSISYLIDSRLIIQGVVLGIVLAIATIAAGTTFIKENVTATNYFKNSQQVITPGWGNYINPHRSKIRTSLIENDKGKVFTLIKAASSDYLPCYNKNLSTVQIRQFYLDNVINNEKGFTHIINSDGSLTLKWNTLKKEKKVIPIVMYPNSALKLNNKWLNISQLNHTAIGNPIITSHKGINQVTLIFRQGRFYLISLIITLISWVVSLITLFIKLTKKRRAL